MPQLKTRSRRRRQTSGETQELTLTEALKRIDPDLATSISIFYSEMARAQRAGDQEGVEYTRRAIAEAMRGVPEGPIDRPLAASLRSRRVKRKK